MNLKNWSVRKKLAVAGIALATLYGSCTHHISSCPPIYTNKTGASGGILASIATNFPEESSFYGGILSLGGENSGKIDGVYVPIFLSIGKENGKVNGLEISLIQGASTYSQLNGSPAVGLGNVKASPSKNGVSIGLFTNAQKMNGAQVGLTNVAGRTNGLQVGLYNSNEGGKNLQVGLVNKVELECNKNRWSIGLNYSWN